VSRRDPIVSVVSVPLPQEPLRVGSLFSGIGGFDLGFERAGMRTSWFVEQDAYCQAVLRKHWPDVPIHNDVCTVGADDLEPVDVLCGGFPCQDLSVAGKGAGLAGARSGLWAEFARLIGCL
jgi:DNA (cytosine-5)-methyltransferase 1